MFVFLVLCVVILITVLYWNKIKCRKPDYWIQRNVKQSDDVLKKFVFGNISLPEIYKEVYDAHPMDPYVGVFRGTKPALLLRDLENIRHVLLSNFESFHQRGLLKNPNDKLADNVLFMDDFPRWKLMRQRILPAFTNLRLNCLFNVMEKCSRELVELMEDNIQIRNSPFYGVYTYATASIGASIFGIDTIRTSNPMDSPFLKMSLEAAGPTLRNNLTFSICNICPWLFKFLGLTFFGEYESFFIGAVNKVIRSRKAKPVLRLDLIDLYINLLDQGVLHDFSQNYEITVSEDFLAAQSFFFFISGADSTANTMHFALFELANNPDILDKVHKEIDKVFIDCEEIVTYDEIQKLKYLEMVIEEVLRKYPPIGLIKRKCTKDTVLPVGNLKVEKDTIVIIPVFAIHRDEKYYPDPDNFDPERFKYETVMKRNIYSYLPFGEGNRMCIGSKYARAQVKMGLAWLLRRFSLQEQTEKVENFEKSFFGIRAPHAHYELISREDSAYKEIIHLPPPSYPFRFS